VEVADLLGGQVGMRDSKDVDGPVLQILPEGWRAFLLGARNGEFDRLASHQFSQRGSVIALFILQAHAPRFISSLSRADIRP
jgi:Domain of unknown function (DUF397)